MSDSTDGPDPTKGQNLQNLTAFSGEIPFDMNAPYFGEPSGHPNFPGGYAPLPPGYGPPGIDYGPQQVPQTIWMPRPSVSNCPPGLEYLTQLDQLLIKQKKELFEMVTNIETENRYVCFNQMGQTVYFCREESDFYKRQYFAASRPFTMHIQDNTGREVIRISRPYKYHCICPCCNCAECCQDELEVEAPVGQVVGYVKQILEGCNVQYKILNAERNTVLKIKGPSYFYCPCFGEDIHFMVMSADGAAQIGRITKQWTNYIQEMLTNADNFGVSFPMDLDVRVKATVIGAVFLIDFMFFEQNPRKNDRN